MANLKISQMGKADALTGAELIPIVKDNENKSATVDLIIKDLATKVYVDSAVGLIYILPLAIEELWDGATEEDILRILKMSKEEFIILLNDIKNNKYKYVILCYIDEFRYVNYIISTYCSISDSGVFNCTFSYLNDDYLFQLNFENRSGSIVFHKKEMTLITSYSIIDKLTSYETRQPLSANQGTILNETKANKTDVYTKAEVDALIAAINK